jgi:hypothetical protein
VEVRCSILLIQALEHIGALKVLVILAAQPVIGEDPFDSFWRTILSSSPIEFVEKH